MLVSIPYGKKYILLFDAISTMKEYDGSLLHTHLQRSFTRSILDKSKGVLYQHIIQLLSRFHRKVSPSIELQHLLLEVSILYTKGQYTSVLHTIAIARTIAYDSEDWVSLLHLISIERNTRLMLQGNWVQEIDSLCKEEKAVQRNYRNDEKYQALFHRHIALSFQHGINPNFSKQQAVWKRLLQHRLLRNKEHLHSKFSLCIYYYMLCWLNFYVRDYEYSYQLSLLFLQTAKSSQTFLQQYSSNYLSILLLHTSLCLYTGRVEEMETGIETLLAFPQSLPTGKRTTLVSYIAIRVCGLRMSYVLHRGYDIIRGQELCRKLDTLLHSKDAKLHKASYIESAHHLATSYVLLGETEKALEWITLILSESNRNHFPDTYMLTLILSLFVHYDLKHYEALPHYIRSVRRFALQISYKAPTLHLALRYLRKLSLSHETDRPTLLCNFLLEVRKTESEFPNLRYFPLSAWIESHIKKQTTAEILAAQVKK